MARKKSGDDAVVTSCHRTHYQIWWFEHYLQSEHYLKSELDIKFEKV